VKNQVSIMLKMLKIICLAIATLLLMLGQPSAALCNPEDTSVQNFAEVNGTRLSYEIVGRGPAVVLIHGGLVDSRLWDDQMKDFSKQCRVVRYDLRGFGKSADVSEPFSHIEDLRALLDVLKIQRATLVGLSLGGIVAADFALEYPERIDRLVLVGPGLRGDKQPPPKESVAAWEAASRGAEPFAEATLRSGLYTGVQPGTVIHTRLRQMLLDNFKAVSSFRPGFLKYPEPPTIERLEKIKAPTLVVIGDRDAPNLKNIADLLAQKIPGARKVLINDASHHPPVEQPKQFNKVVLDFIRNAG
jgi:pimeloyl-ACP methyl ester carboxylesterase